MNMFIIGAMQLELNFCQHMHRLKYSGLQLQVTQIECCINTPLGPLSIIKHMQVWFTFPY